MEEIKYSEKEIAIFNGLISIMKEGTNPYLIKVSDIAKAANIGKGTIYDYFDSKEEVISKAILYNVGEEIKSAIEIIKAKEGFKNRFYGILEIMEENFDKKISTLNLLLSSGGIEKFYESLKDKEYTISIFLDLINREIKNLLDLGFKEKIIKREEGDHYQIMAVLGSVSSFSKYFNNKSLNKDVSLEEAKDIVYKILIKSLN